MSASVWADLGELLVVYAPFLWWTLFLWLMRNDERRASRTALLTWMLGFLIALSVANFWLAVTILSRLPRP